MEKNNRYSENDRRYDDILYLPHHISGRHPQMPRVDRAAQFAPFAALTGHGEAIKETARRTEGKRELDENQKGILDARLQLIVEQIPAQPEVAVEYFVPDERKSGGQYVTERGRVKKIDTYRQKIVMMNGTEIPICEVVGLDGEMFRILDNGDL